MCNNDLGCQLRTNYYGFRLGFTGAIEGALGDYAQLSSTSVLGGNASYGGDFALTWRRGRSESPQDGSFEGIGANLGYNFSRSARSSWVHMPYFTLELWTHDARITPYAGVAYTQEHFDNGQDRYGGRILIGTLWRPFTAPFQNDKVNPYLGGHIFIGGEGGDGHGGFVIGLQLNVGLDFFPLF